MYIYIYVYVLYIYYKYILEVKNILEICIKYKNIYIKNPGKVMEFHKIFA